MMTTTAADTAAAAAAADNETLHSSDKEHDCYQQLIQEANNVLLEEPELTNLLKATILHPRVDSFPSAIASTMVYRLLGPTTMMTTMNNINGNSFSHPNGSGNLSSSSSMSSTTTMITPVEPSTLYNIFCEAYTNGTACTTEDCYHYHDLHNDDDESESTKNNNQTPIRQILMLDILCVMDRDPAMNTLLEVVLFAKGFASLACHRVSHWKWTKPLASSATTTIATATIIPKKRKPFLALWLQSTISAVFGVDIHPASRVGSAVMFDHGTGIVVGETAVIGSGSTLLHAVTLGGTGKAKSVDRHPKVGRHVLIGAGAKILGNIQIGEAAKIGAGSVVLRPIPAGATAVGAPAKIIGHKMEADPAATNDQTLSQVNRLHKSVSDSTLNGDLVDEKTTFTGGSSSVTSSSSSSDEERSLDRVTGGDLSHLCPYRDYTLLAFKAPKGTITINNLMKYLVPLGQKSCEIGPIMFELDQRNVGYVRIDEFELRGKDCISRSTHLPTKDVDYVFDHIVADATAQKLAHASKKLRVA